MVAWFEFVCLFRSLSSFLLLSLFSLSKHLKIRLPPVNSTKKMPKNESVSLLWLGQVFRGPEVPPKVGWRALLPPKNTGIYLGWFFPIVTHVSRGSFALFCSISQNRPQKTKGRDLFSTGYCYSFETCPPRPTLTNILCHSFPLLFLPVYYLGSFRQFSLLEVWCMSHILQNICSRSSECRVQVQLRGSVDRRT